MNPLRVLMIIPYLPNQTNVVTILAKKVLNDLKKKCDAKIIWILQTPSQTINYQSDDIEVKPIQQYRDACDLMDKEKPDVIFVDLSFDYSSYPFIIAGRYKKIPVVSYIAYGYDYIYETLSRFEIIFSKVSRFLSRNSGQYDNNQMFGKGRFYLYKYFFFLRTVRSTKISLKSYLMIILDSIWVNSFGVMSRKLDKRLIVDSVCLATESWVNQLTKEGFPKNILHVTGSPIFDKYNIESFSHREFHKFPLKVLIVTSTMKTHGVWTDKKQQEIIEQIILELKKHSDKFEFAIKIHPTSDDMEFYQNIIRDIDPSIKIFQKENILDLLKEFDIAVSYGMISGSTFDILYSGLSLVIVNLFGKSYLPHLAQMGLITECYDISNLADSIIHATKTIPPEKELKQFFFSASKPLDGKASERMAQVILSTVKMTNTEKKE